MWLLPYLPIVRLFLNLLKSKGIYFSSDIISSVVDSVPQLRSPLGALLHVSSIVNEFQ